jgi:hypothetical protein
MMKVKIIWQGNAISCMKLFGNWDSAHDSSGGMENHKPLQWNLWCMLAQNEVSQVP